MSASVVLGNDVKNVKKTVLSISIIELDNYDEIGPSNELVRENYIHYFALVTSFIL